MEKTAMQELIEWANERTILLGEGYKPLVRVATELLAKEKEQMVNFCKHGMSGLCKDAEDYYNSTYQVK